MDKATKRERRQPFKYQKEIDALCVKIRHNVYILRSSTGLTQEAFGEAIGCTRDHISKIECDQNTPSIPLLIEMSHTFKYPLHSLIPNTDYKNNDSIADEVYNLISNCSEDNKIKVLNILKVIISELEYSINK